MNRHPPAEQKWKGLLRICVADAGVGMVLGGPYAQDSDPEAGISGLRSGVINLWELMQGSCKQIYVLGIIPKMLLCPPLS